MSQNRWTEAQKQAIEGSGGGILVSVARGEFVSVMGAAGSGKTAVLVERVVELLTRREEPVDADRLLVVTFSNAAAREMKQRIAKRLWELSQQEPGNTRLARQQLLLESAQISTIHSFCSTLIRGYFQYLRLPAEFRIGEERELEVLRMRVIQELIEEEYQSGEEQFFDLVELLSTARSDRGLEQNILKLYDFVRNHPFYEEWMEKVLREYDSEKPLGETQWAAILLGYAKDGVDYCLELNGKALEEMAGELASVKDMGYEVGALEKAGIGGKTFDRFTARLMGGALYQEYYGIRVGDYVAILTASYEENGKAAVEELIGGIRGTE